MARVLDRAATGLVLEQVGGAAALDISVDYLKTVQCGQPSGAFQALRNMAADVFVDVETDCSETYYAMAACRKAKRGVAGCCASDRVLQRCVRQHRPSDDPVSRWHGVHLEAIRASTTSARSSQILLDASVQHVIAP
ncbi:putative acyl-CoA dehydrogenase domain protein [Mycobacterium avium subsp. avium 2285 (R)]|nr:putative acyl-CoA dehydrogenase domain protein [Mycobacterium avium subsp. avium 2285 (R)]